MKEEIFVLEQLVFCRLMRLEARKHSFANGKSFLHLILLESLLFMLLIESVLYPDLCQGTISYRYTKNGSKLVSERDFRFISCTKIPMIIPVEKSLC